MLPKAQINNKINPKDGKNEDPGSHHLKRALQARHLTMISIGGTIGTGLFLSSGASIAKAGPIGALLAYSIIGVIVHFMMTSLGEMATYIPISGSFNTYAKRFVDPALGFALGWNYWYFWAMTIAVEIVAAAIIIKYWLPYAPTWIFSIVILLVMLIINMFTVRGYGETEYWLSLIKIITVFAFIVTGILLNFGIIGKTHEVIGMKNYSAGITDFYGFLAVILTAGFSFQGTELVGIAAGESKNPEKNVPKAIHQVYWRILLFYIFAIIVVGLLVPHNDPHLIANGLGGSAQSPFTIVFHRTGLEASTHLVNVVILVAVLSAGNSGLYAASRVLYNLAVEGNAPKVFQYINKDGIPLPALLATTGVGCLAFLMSFIELPYKSQLFPFGPIFTFCLLSILIVGQTIHAFLDAHHGHKDPLVVITAYSGAPLFFMLFFIYKIVKRTKMVPLRECDFDRGFDPSYVEMDEKQYNILTKMTAVVIKGGKRLKGEFANISHYHYSTNTANTINTSNIDQILEVQIL
ncbi:9710_t:CDS:2 [Entrophospora sp. SA101]|nr:9710_t:CDS:2 [Entrophospora sp. SA101]